VSDASRPRSSGRRALTDYAKVRRAIGAMVRNRSFQARRPSLAARRYLDLGCGINTHEQFVNVDYQWIPGVDVCWDLARKLPFEDGRFQGVFSEHCLEHFSLAAADRIVGECRRVLAPGGTLRLIVPDAEVHLRAYAGDSTASRTELPYAETDVYEGFYTPLLSVNRLFIGDGHRFIFDHTVLRWLLDRHGFTAVTRARFRTGRDPALLIDSAQRASESSYGDLYVEASAPL
jgi:SAM-dependent methyltransferase